MHRELAKQIVRFARQKLRLPRELCAIFGMAEECHNKITKAIAVCDAQISARVSTGCGTKWFLSQPKEEEEEEAHTLREDWQWLCQLYNNLLFLELLRNQVAQRLRGSVLAAANCQAVHL